MYPNRTICEVFEAMRSCDKTKNYSYLLGLIEEGQMMANRMESTLSDKNDCKMYQEERKELEKEIRKLRIKKEDLEENVR